MERITKDLPEADRRGHEFRYRLASGFCYSKNVLDAACGTGYGSHILSPIAIQYHGVDVYKADELYNRAHFIQADLHTWEPDFDFDVFVGFETIEHLADYSHYINIAKRAGQWIVLSVPVVPTVGINPYHLHDFESGELPGYIVDDDWELYQSLGQPSELSEIYVFGRHKV